MPELEAQLIGSDLQQVITNAQEAVVPHVLEDGAIYAVRNDDGGVELLTTPGYDDAKMREAAADGPVRVARKVTVRDAASLLDYLAENTRLAVEHVTDDLDPNAQIVGYFHSCGVGNLELWANVDGRRITAILDGGNGNREHTATLELRHSPEWSEWTGIDGKLIQQVNFAQFIEDHISSIGSPDGGTLLDVVQTLTAKNKVDFKSSTLLANGQRQFEFAETIEAKAGQKGQLTVPTELTLVLRPFQGSEPVAITARFRYRLDEGQLFLGVRLAEPQRALEVAFDQIVSEVQQSVPVRVNHGVG